MSRYWLDSILKHDNIALRFPPQEQIDRVALLDVKPKPDVVTRVYMLFQGIESTELDKWTDAQSRAKDGVAFWREVTGVEDEDRQTDSGLFRVLEWGGMEIK